MKRLFALLMVMATLLTACPAATPTTPPAETPLASIALSCTPSSIAVNATSTCTATGKDSSGTNLTTQPSFTFASSDTGKATVSGTGVVTGIAAGSSNVTAVSSGVTSNAVAMTVTAAGAFADPNFVTATTVSSSQILLQWETPGTKAAPIIPTGYTVERRTNRPNDTTFQVIVTITGNTQRDYNDTLLTANVEYIYRVKATYAGGSSAGVIVGAITTPPIR